ncbi:SpoIIE family protein phosphatase [Streptomyces sp. NPDC127119]|uniref:SpoIIE family protein phosphatase n=1 Tax=Streptomyces sp. NPDC127119 TaxID=3345370 RepID=UPI003631AB06
MGTSGDKEDGVAEAGGVGEAGRVGQRGATAGGWGKGDFDSSDDRAQFSALLEDSVEDLYEHAPCGYLSTLLDGRIAKINTTLLDWLGYERDDLLGRRHFSDLLTVGGRLYHETHFAPLLRMQGQVSGIALELKAADGSRLPVLVTSTVRTGRDGQPLLIRTTLFDARDRRAYETELLRARKEAERERERLQRLAATLQKTLLPPALANVPGLDVSAYYHIASVDEVGGDFYDLFPLAEGTWGLFLGDVCGKGAAAAAVTSLTRYTLRAAAVYNPDPVAVLRNLNTVLNHEYNGADPRFCTVIFGLLTPDPDRGGFHITLASGGHPPALLMRADGTTDHLPTPGGQLIGVLADAHIGTTAVRLAPGDTLLLHTDGLTEAHVNAVDGEDRYGDDALLDFARTLAPTTASDTVDAIRDLLDTFGSGVDDDTAVLAIHVPGLPVPRPPSEELP